MIGDMMNKKGFAISVILYSMVILVISIMYLVLGIVKDRYNLENQLKESAIDYIDENFEVID